MKLKPKITIADHFVELEYPRVGSPDFEVITKPHILDSEGITESRIVAFDTVYTINPGEPKG
jgi:hypothetical protein